MRFEQAYETFMDKHKKTATGERLRKLGEHGYLEQLLLKNVIWPAIGTLDQLYPEYEVLDFKDGDRFLDYALIIDWIRICLEADGFNTHAKGMTVWQFNDERNRQNDLVIDGWFVLRFTRDDIVNNPRKCQMKLQQLLGKLMLQAEHSSAGDFSFLERAVIRYAAFNKGSVTPIDLERYLGMGKRKVVGLIDNLLAKGAIEALREGERVRRYKLTLKDVTSFLRL